MTRDQLVSAYETGGVELACLGVTTSVVGGHTALRYSYFDEERRRRRRISQNARLQPARQTWAALNDINEAFAHPLRLRR